jgi:predicted GNAT family N-acyltransferase
LSADPGLSLTVRPTEDRGEIEAAWALREQVFCGEQGVTPAEEFDGLEDEATQIVALAENGVVATCRLRRLGGDCRLERMAVRKRLRGTGVGRALLECAEAVAREDGSPRMVLNAQTRALGFYAANGYAPEGEAFIEAGIEHVRMTKDLSRAGRA